MMVRIIIFSKNFLLLIIKIFEDGGVLKKGCYSDIPDSTRDLCDDANYLDCKKCSGESCNMETKREGIKCHQCSGVDCLIIDTQSSLIDCRSSCYIGMNGEIRNR